MISGKTSGRPGYRGMWTALTLVSGLVSGLVFWGDPAQAQTQTPGPVHALAMHGAPKYPADFQRFDYVNPDAPKGGELRLAAIGSFDSLNPYILKGTPAAGVGLLFDTLTEASADEPFSRYGLIAETMEVAADKASITFRLRPQARFHDGSPVTAADVAFTFDLLMTKGHPQYRAYYHDVLKAEVVDPRTVTFHFRDGTNAELPLIVSELPVLSKAFYSTTPFDQTSLVPPLGSGPYKVRRVDAGRTIVLERDPNYWAKDLPVKRGRHNFAQLRYEYFRDDAAALEAFLAGQTDLRVESVALRWATAYETPAAKSGAIRKSEFKTSLPRGMQAFVMNTRRPFFQDARVRQAMAYAFDFEWSNKTLFFGAYKRTTSYFMGSELAATGLPSPEELALLEPLRAQIPPDVFTKPYAPPMTDGAGSIRTGLREALRLLREAGYEVKNGKLTGQDGKPVELEFIDDNPAFERIVLPFTKNLEQMGITVKFRILDPAQNQRRMDSFDFDLTNAVFGQSESPGNEQRDFFGSTAARIEGSRNLMGIANPAVDTLIEAVIRAKSRADLIAATRALDRVLLWNHYVVPQWHNDVTRVAHWDRFGWPEVPNKYGFLLDLWWIDPAKARP